MDDVMIDSFVFFVCWLKQSRCERCVFQIYELFLYLLVVSMQTGVQI